MSKFHEFDTGAVRSLDADGFRYDLISPIGLEEVARTYAEGSAKYGDFNWEKGMPVHDLLNHAIRHVYRYLGGDRSEPHLAHAAWGLLAAIHSEAKWPNLNKGHLRAFDCWPPSLNPCRQTPDREDDDANEDLCDDGPEACGGAGCDTRVRGHGSEPGPARH